MIDDPDVVETTGTKWKSLENSESSINAKNYFFQLLPEMLPICA